MKTSYLYPTKHGYTKVTRRIGKVGCRKPKTGFAERMVAPVLLVLTMTISGTMYIAKTLTVQQVQAEEVSPVTSSPVPEQGVANNAELDSPKPTTTPSPKQEIIDYIVEVFGEDADDAIAVATCESNLNPLSIGDRNLITWHGNDIVGDSIGLFQIRTGGKDFNRARANGMSPDDFREYLLDWKNNVDYAKTIFDRSDWQPWTCKKVL